MHLSFHGADRDVTGSCHLIECAGRRVLIDCGLFQGSRELDADNAAPFGFAADSIDYVLLTHAHLDHCGRLPLLAQRGFRGEVITTSATRELARLVMLDSAHLQEADARDRARKAARRGTTNGKPLYSTTDALNCLDYFGRSANYGEPIELAPGLRATFLDAGHILGSASIFLELEEAGQRRTILFSGDIGNPGHPLLRGPVTPPRADVVVMETTYGDRLHKSLPDSIEELYEAVTDTFRRGGNVIIPTFALERAQELLYFLGIGVDKGRLTKSTPVYLDSPMAVSATEIFERHPECYEAKTAEMFRNGHDPFQLPGLHFVRETAGSIAINSIRGGAIIMAGSGMCTGGRIRHHLKHNLWRPECSIVFVGYAADGTLARRIIDGARHVRVLDDDIPVRARIHTINGFSAHADQAALLAWQKATQAGRTFLVHGEEGSMQQFASRLTGTRVEMPKLNEGFDL
ncbi:MAG: MBL fold metallo-hydrolase [Xanthobacteraceae bacterium]